MKVALFLGGLLVALAAVSAQKDWWQTAVFYQIYPRSFKDSTNDGVGDIRGIYNSIQHLTEAGINGLWLSPVLKSPQKDYGYDISDFRDIDPLFGTMANFEQLIAECKNREIKMILDFVPNHTSTEHEWFIKSENRDEGFEDYYIWRDAKEGGGPPNNWVSVFYGSAWTWSDKRKQYYLHQFDAGQPDLNYHNPVVVQEMKDVLTFWLDKGIDGFRVDAINHMFEYEDLRDEPLSGFTTDPNDYGYLLHYYTKDLDETYDMITQWRKLLDDYKLANGGDTRIMMTEAYANQSYTQKYYDAGAHFPFNFVFIENLNGGSNAFQVRENIDSWIFNAPSGATHNWVLGNHDKPRLASRYGTERADGMIIIEMTLPGVAITYNGEEIGMVDNCDISWEDTRDPQACNGPQEGYLQRSRDPQRAPFQWDDSQYAGFSTAKPWLPVNSNKVLLNLALQKQTTKSVWKFYQDIISLRKRPAMQNGNIQTLSFNDKVYGHSREYEDEFYLTIVNFSAEFQTIDVNRLYNIGDLGEIVVAGARSSFSPGDRVDTRSFQLRSYDAVVLTRHK